MALPRVSLSDGRGAALMATLVVASLLTLTLSIGDTSKSDLLPGVETTSYALVLGAAVLTYLRWRMTARDEVDPVPGRLAAWLTLGLSAGAVHGLLEAAPFDTPGGVGERWNMAGELVLLLLFCLVASVADQVDVPGNPAFLGVVLAVGVSSAQSLALSLTAPLPLVGSQALALGVALALTGLGLAWIVLRVAAAEARMRRRLAAAVVLLTSAECATNMSHGVPWLVGYALVAFVLGSLVLCALTQELLRDAVLEHAAELESLHQSLAQVRAAVLEDRALLHEVGATIAGISSASQVMRQEQAVPAHKRQRLEAMLAAELARLERLMLARSPDAEAGEDREIDLDSVVEPLVTSHQTRGRDVRWQPSGQCGTGDPDELAEVVNILLENAASHAPGSVVRLSVQASGDEVVAICTDSGPGVPAAMRHLIFDRDVRREASPGQGLGLAIAHQLATARGGSLELVDVDRPGATFVARLPRKEHAHDAAGHVA